MTFIPNFDWRNPRSQPVWYAVDVLYPATFRILALAPRVDYAFIKLKVRANSPGPIQTYVMAHTGQTPPPRLLFGYRPVSYEYSPSDSVDIFGYPGQAPRDLSRPLLKCTTPLHVLHNHPEIMETRVCPFSIGCSGGPALIPDSEEPGQRQIGVISRDERVPSNGVRIYVKTDIVGFPLSVERSHEDWANLPAQ